MWNKVLPPDFSSISSTTYSKFSNSHFIPLCGIWDPLPFGLPYRGVLTLLSAILFCRNGNYRIATRYSLDEQNTQASFQRILAGFFLLTNQFDWISPSEVHLDPIRQSPLSRIRFVHFLLLSEGNCWDTPSPDGFLTGEYSPCSRRLTVEVGWIYLQCFKLKILLHLGCVLYLLPLQPPLLKGEILRCSSHKERF